MPLIHNSSYKAPLLFRFNHFNTTFPALFREVNDVKYSRERITTPDQDFIDMDWSKIGSSNLIIMLHGLEGSANRPYVKGMIRYFNQRNWDGVGMNFRGCSGEPNRHLRSYHMGETGDLDFILRHIQKRENYEKIVLIGYSLGGNVILKYLGEKGKELQGLIHKAVVFSVPCHTVSANKKIGKWYNRLYVNSFMKSLNEKVLKKRAFFPPNFEIDNKKFPRNFPEFDGRFTAPLHGFESALDYWEKADSRQYLADIQIPALLINAKDDSFLSDKCYPYEAAADSDYLFLETPRHGGHVGFVSFSQNGDYWTEKRAYEFVNQEKTDK